MIGSSLAQAIILQVAGVTLVDSCLEAHGANWFNLHRIRNNPKLHIDLVDICDVNAMTKHVRGKDYIFNLAGQVSHNDSLNNPLLDFDINYRGHVIVLEACIKNNPCAKIINAGSRLRYGRIKNISVDETHERGPLTRTPRTKMQRKSITDPVIIDLD